MVSIDNWKHAAGGNKEKCHKNKRRLSQEPTHSSLVIVAWELLKFDSHISKTIVWAW